MGNARARRRRVLRRELAIGVMTSLVGAVGFAFAFLLAAPAYGQGTARGRAAATAHGTVVPPPATGTSSAAATPTVDRGSGPLRCETVPRRWRGKGKAKGRTLADAHRLQRQVLGHAPGRQLHQALRARAAELAPLCRASPAGRCQQALFDAATRAAVEAIVQDPSCLEATRTLSGRLMQNIVDPLDPADALPPEYILQADDGAEWHVYAEDGSLPLGPITLEDVDVLDSDVYVGPKAKLRESSSGGDVVAPWTSSLHLLADATPWYEGMFDVPRHESLGDSKVLLVQVENTDSPVTLSAATVDALAARMGDHYRTVSYGLWTPTVEPFPRVVRVAAGTTCSPRTSFQQFLSQIDPEVDFREYRSVHMLGSYPSCGWCGIANLDAWGTHATDDGTVAMGTAMTRESCAIDNRKTPEHEWGHNIGWIHANRWGLPGLFWFPVDEPFVAGSTEYANYKNWQGASTSGGHPGPLMKGYQGWLPGDARMRWNPPAGNYDLAPVSSPEGLVFLGVRIGAHIPFYLEFRQPGDAIEQYALSKQPATTGNWDACVFLGLSIGRDYPHEADRTLANGNRCLPKGQVVTHPSSGFSVRLNDITIDQANPNRSRAHITLLNPGTPDFTLPVTRFVAPAATTTRLTVTGEVTFRVELTDNAGVGAFFTILDVDDQFTRRLGHTLLPNAPVNGTGTVSFTWDSRTVPNGETRVWVQGVDGVNVSGFGTQYLVLNVQNGGTGATTTSTIQGVTTTTVKPPTTTTLPGTVPVAVLAVPETVASGTTFRADLCASDPRGGVIDWWYFTVDDAPDSTARSSVLCRRDSVTTNDPRCEGGGADGLEPCRLRLSYEGAGDVGIMAWVHTTEGKWSAAAAASVAVTGGPTTSSLVSTTTVSSTSSLPSTTSSVVTTSSLVSTSSVPTSSTRPPVTTTTVPPPVCGPEGAACRAHWECRAGAAECAAWRCRAVKGRQPRKQCEPPTWWERFSDWMDWLFEASPPATEDDDGTAAPGRGVR